MTNERIIELFQKRDEQAIRESMEAYGAYCRTVAAGILSNDADIEEALSDTWMAAWNSIPPQQPKYLRLFFGRIARNKAIGIWRRNNAQARGSGQVALALEELGQCVSSESSPEMEVSSKELQQSITEFLREQPIVRRQVFLRRYFYMEEISSIARRYGLKESNVRMMLSRTRQKLRKYLVQEGYIL